MDCRELGFLTAFVGTSLTSRALQVHVCDWAMRNKVINNLVGPCGQEGQASVAPLLAPS